MGFTELVIGRRFAPTRWLNPPTLYRHSADLLDDTFRFGPRAWRKFLAFRDGKRASGRGMPLISLT